MRISMAEVLCWWSVVVFWLKQNEGNACNAGSQPLSPCRPVICSKIHAAQGESLHCTRTARTLRATFRLCSPRRAHRHAPWKHPLN